MNLFLEILTITIFILLIRECFTIHMGFFCAYSNDKYYLLTIAYTFLLSTLVRNNIIVYKFLHVFIIAIVVIGILVIKSIMDDIHYNKTHPRDDIRRYYQTIIFDIIDDKFDNSIDFIFETYNIASAFTDILKFNDLKEDEVRNIVNHVFNEVSLEKYDIDECERIQKIIRRDFPNLKEEL